MSENCISKTDSKEDSLVSGVSFESWQFINKIITKSYFNLHFYSKQRPIIIVRLYFTADDINPSQIITCSGHSFRKLIDASAQIPLHNTWAFFLLYLQFNWRKFIVVFNFWVSPILKVFKMFIYWGTLYRQKENLRLKIKAHFSTTESTKYLFTITNFYDDSCHCLNAQYI